MDNTELLRLKIKQFLPLFILIFLWETFAYYFPSISFKYSSPSKIISTFYIQLTDKKIIEQYNIYKSFYLTFSEIIFGFIIGNIIGSFMGLFLWFSKETARISKPYLIAIGSIPIFALAPVLILWFGTGFWAKVYMAAFSTFLVATAQAYEGAQNVDDDQINLLKSFGASRIQILRKLILPSSLIWVFTSYRLNIGFAIIGAFIGEWISSEYGLGHLILRAGGLYDVSLIFVGLICLMIISLIMSLLLNLVEKKALKWKFESIQQE